MDANGPVLQQISAALQAGRQEDALLAARTALHRTPRDPRLWTLQAMAQSASGDPAAAETSLRQAVAVTPGYLPAWQALAQLQYSRHEPAANATLNRVVALAPQDPVAHAMLAALAFAHGDCPAVVAEFAQARAFGVRPDVAQQWGSCLLQLGKPQEAASLLKTALAASPGEPVLRYDTALAQWKSGDTTGAQQTLTPLLAAAHPASDALVLGAELAEEVNRTQSALDLLRSAILTDPRNRDAYLDFARLAYDHASMQVGIDMLNIGLKNLGDDARLYFARGVLLAQNGKMDQTLADLDRASQLDPKLSFVGTAQGIAASQAHQFAAAEQRLREQTRLHPDDAAAWYLLAEALAEQPLDDRSPKHVEMVHAAEQAVRLDPHSADAHSQLAAIYLRNNDPARAIAECNAALTVHPDDPQTVYQLLLATRKAGQKEQLPALVARLVAAREATEAKEKADRKQTLVEVPTVAVAGSTP